MQDQQLAVTLFKAANGRLQSKMITVQLQGHKGGSTFEALAETELDVSTVVASGAGKRDDVLEFILQGKQTRSGRCTFRVQVSPFLRARNVAKQEGFLECALVPLPC